MTELAKKLQVMQLEQHVKTKRTEPRKTVCSRLTDWTVACIERLSTRAVVSIGLFPPVQVLNYH